MASGTIGEKDGDVAHIEETRRGSGGAIDKMRFDDERVPEARGRDLDALPKSYWISPLFVGSYIAIGCGFAAATGGFALVAPLLTVINDDLGPSDNITWVALVYLLCQAVFFLIVGRLTDIFGRRWFFISGSVIGLIGSILGATATSINQMIAAELFIGIASGFQISFFWVVAELVPMKYRYIASSGLYFITFPTNPLAAKVALTIYSNTGGWRGCFYLLIGANGLSVLCWYFFYREFCEVSQTGRGQ